MSTGALQPGVAAAADSSATPQGGAAAAAPATFWTRLDAGLDRVSDHLNPILVKETRQALRSRQFVLWFLLLLAACWLVTIGGVAWMGPGVQYAAGGGLMFMCYYCVLAFAVVIVVPYAAFRSLSSEQEENTRDVLMVSALRPSQIINGKLGGAVLQIGVYLSALSPCLAFTYLLRGIDLRTILLLPVFAVA
ncbi:MAG: ABC transporter permease, partial [Planctomycetota bacterium]